MQVFFFFNFNTVRSILKQEYLNEWTNERTDLISVASCAKIQFI